MITQGDPEYGISRLPQSVKPSEEKVISFSNEYLGLKSAGGRGTIAGIYSDKNGIGEEKRCHVLRL